MTDGSCGLLIRRIGYEVHHPNSFAYRLAGRYIYIVVSEPLPSEPAPAPGQYQPPPPRSFHLLTLELKHGTVCQDMRVGETSMPVCRIEDVDERGLLLSSGDSAPYTPSGKILQHFEVRHG